MPSAVAGPEIERLIQLLARLPGLGPRSERRAALHLIKKREALMTPLSTALQVAIDKIQVCKTCGNIDTQNPCTDRKSTRLNSSHTVISYAVFCLKKKNTDIVTVRPGSYEATGSGWRVGASGSSPTRAAEPVGKRRSGAADGQARYAGHPQPFSAE